MNEVLEASVNWKYIEPDIWSHAINGERGREYSGMFHWHGLPDGQWTDRTDGLLWEQMGWISDHFDVIEIRDSLPIIPKVY